MKTSPRRRVVAFSPSATTVASPKNSIATISLPASLATQSRSFPRIRKKVEDPRHVQYLIRLLGATLLFILQIFTSENLPTSQTKENWFHPRQTTIICSDNHKIHFKVETNHEKNPNIDSKIEIVSKPKSEIQRDETDNQESYFELSNRRVDEFNDKGKSEDEIDEDKEWIDELEEEIKKDCEHKEKWMYKHNAPSTCHLLHEFFSLETTSSLHFINCGTAHCALSFRDAGVGSLVTSTPSIVMKITKLDDDAIVEEEEGDEEEEEEEEGNRDLTEEQKYEQSWRETIGLERMQSSPFVLDIFANCQHSQLTEMGYDASINGSMSLLDWINIMREYPEDYRPLVDSRTKLIVAYQLAAAVSDIHHGSCLGKADHYTDKLYCMAHNDLFVHQFLFINGKFKLNDFNIANHARVHKTDPEKQCMDTISEMESGADKSKTPEELLRFWYYDDEVKTQPLVARNKVDVWYLGEAIYHILTLKWIFEDLDNTAVVRDLILNGRTPPFPPSILESDDPFVQKMVEVIQKCWTYDPTERPTSLEVRRDLETALVDLGISLNRNDLIASSNVQLPPIPPDYDHSEDDFNMSLYGIQGLIEGWFYPRSEELIQLSIKLWDQKKRLRNKTKRNRNITKQ